MSIFRVLSYHCPAFGQVFHGHPEKTRVSNRVPVVGKYPNAGSPKLVEMR
jgi:hypothetical protein